MYFSFFKLKKWGKKTAAARRHNCAVLPYGFTKIKANSYHVPFEAVRIRLGFYIATAACRTNSLPPLGVVLRAANRDSNDCRWQSYLCFVPQSGKGGGVGDFELLQPSNGTPSVSPFGLPAPPLGSQGRFFPFQGRSADVPSFSWMRAAASWVAARRAFSRVSPAVPTSISRE